MNKTSFHIKLILLFSLVSTLSCKNEGNEKKVPDTTKAAAEATSDSLTKADSTGTKRNNAANISEQSQKKQTDTAATVTTATKKAERKMKEKVAAAKDTSASAAGKNAAAITKGNTSGNPTPASQSTDKPFVSKYGIIPRDANENSMTVFFNTFPDKTTLIKVNFDGPADAEMNSVKTQIIKVLKKNGYTNVPDRSETIEPKRMPKEIHYELQHDGSVVFWVPIANQEQ
jgi:hypothetical protein